MARYNVLPAWYYRHVKCKPFTCMTCLCFWLGALFTFAFTDAHWLLAFAVGLSASALTIIIVKLTE